VSVGQLAVMSLHVEKLFKVNYTAVCDYVQWIFWVAFCKHFTLWDLMKRPSWQNNCSIGAEVHGAREKCNN